MNLKSVSKNILLKPQDTFSYASTYGKDELRKLWKSHIYDANPYLKANISLPVVTAGITHSVWLAAYLFANGGDKIIIPDMMWENYNLIFKSNFSCQIETFNTFEGESFDTNGLEEKLTAKSNGKKILLLNFPNNPTGYTPTKKGVEHISNIILDSAEKNKVAVICDDAYFGLVYEDEIFKESIFSRIADIHENVLAIKVDGATKENYMWGFRTGFITYSSKNISERAYMALEDKTAGAIRSSVSNCSHISQSLLIESLKSLHYKKEKEEKYKILEKRYLKVKEVLKNPKFSKYFSPLPFNSGYFMCLKLRNLNSDLVRKKLLEKYNTGVISIGNLIRVAFSGTPEKDIGDLINNIYEACKDLS